MKLTNFPFKNKIHRDAYFWMLLMLNDLHPTYKIETNMIFFHAAETATKDIM